MDFILKKIGELPEFKGLMQSIENHSLPVSLTGLSDIHKASFINALSSKLSCPNLILVPNEASMQNLFECLKPFGRRIFCYPSRDFAFYDIEGKSSEYEHERLNALVGIEKGLADIVIAPIDAALQHTVPVNVLNDNLITLSETQVLPIDNIVDSLISCGYEKSHEVEGPGQISQRGCILDVFPVGSAFPIRVEYWGDEIDSISQFDPYSQRRLKSIKHVLIPQAKEVIIKDTKKLICDIDKIVEKLASRKIPSKAVKTLEHEKELLISSCKLPMSDKFINLLYEKTTLFDYFKDYAIFIDESIKVLDRLKGTSWQQNEDIKSFIEDGILCTELGTFNEDECFFKNSLNNKKVVYLDTFPHNSYPTAPYKTLSVSANTLPPLSGTLSNLQENLKEKIENKSTVVILAGNDKTAVSISDDLNKIGISSEYKVSIDSVQDGKIYITSGHLTKGFEYPYINFSVFTLGVQDFKKSKTSKKKKNTKKLYSLADINIGDYVVHSLHGIGIFKGIHKVKVQNIEKDYIKIEYAKKDTLYVPVTQLDMVDKYIGPKENINVKLNRLGSNDWQNSKNKVKLAAKSIAKELIKLYSERMNTKGYAFSEDNELQHDFDAHFEYEETEDQLKCIEEVKKDMQSPHPMDRLLCGDVGFGKTEVALRAAFKCVADSKQCAILVPTTILAWQHYQNIVKRFDNFPVRISLLSRFKTPKQQKEILKKLKNGEIDIIVGTHRLVQDDVKFRDLGLAIIDEEQRFGVKQKEKFKTLVKNIDVLTLSATPIPRTLNMAMSGIRDMSTLEESPQNRHPVQTYVLEHDQAVINEAIRRELRRNGQVYYLYNNVENISLFANKLQLQIPEAKIATGHGKMTQTELSEVWEKVMNHEVDVLVCTTIIETGVDIPNVNTLIIENADRFGLSQLHQIRGRVGRSSKRAYAYFTFKKNKVLTEISQKRLEAIREFTQFGSGFKIAMRDLELRGAGNILSGQQHGHIADVGYDMYLKLLGEAINEEKGIKTENESFECAVDIQIPAFIPEKYINNVNQRIDIYRKISDIRSDEDASDVTDELIDRFSSPPRPVLNLIDIALIRSKASKCKISEIKQQGNKIMLFGESIDKTFIDDLLMKFKNVKLKNKPKSHIILDADSGESLIKTLKNILR